jgi:transcriptional regulator with XRE-family HTH domain
MGHLDDERFTPQAIWGRELRFYREKAGLTQAELAARLFCSDSLISSIETGQSPATEEFTKAADTALNTGGALFRLLDWRKGVPAYPSWFIDWLPAEDKAILIRTFGLALIPGLLQTEDYARAMLGDETDVAARVARQEILTRQEPAPVELYCVLDEAVLRRDIGGAAVMYAQCQHLAKMGEAENISIRVVPSRKHRGVRGPFAIATLESGAQVGQTETSFGGIVSTRTEDVTTITASWEAISSASLPEDMSRDMIMRIAEELWKTS